MESSLPAGYYRDNFIILLDFVDELYADLLSPRERNFSLAFRACSLPAQRLFVRLISRKGPHFRADKLAYDEIPALPEAAGELCEAGLLVIDGPYDLGDLLGLLLRPELVEMASSLARGSTACLAIPAAKRKPELIAAIALAEPEEVLRDLVGKRISWYTPQHEDTLLIYRLLFFGNLSQTLTEFVLLDLGLLKYEDYGLDKQSRLFASREMLLDTLTYYRLAELAHQAIAAGEGETLAVLCECLPETHGERRLERKRDRILIAAGRYFERQGLLDTALILYGRASAPPARERQCRILTRIEDHREALLLCESILAAPQTEAESQFANEFLPKLNRKLGLPSERPERLNHPVTDLSLPFPAGERVEQAVLNYYRERGIHGFYAENHFWLALFGLAFWDIIFKPVRGAFFNRYQRGPRGLFSPEFRAVREAEVQSRLAEMVEDPQWRAQPLALYDRKAGIANHLINWNMPARESISVFLETADPRTLAAIFDRLSRDLGEFKSGLPDLVLLRDNHAGFELVEVKGPGDQLQANQRRWLRYLHRHHIPYRLARVTWT